MAFVLKDGHGTLHRNNKDGVETRPDYRGELVLGRTTYEIAAWIKDGAKGKWMSLNVKPKEQRQEPNAAPPIEVDSDIPF